MSKDRRDLIRAALLRRKKRAEWEKDKKLVESVAVSRRFELRQESEQKRPKTTPSYDIPRRRRA